MELPFSQWAAAALTERHRPKSYAKVFGQERAKELLRAAAVGSNEDPRLRGRSVLLFGPDGTGKTCLADIYARALLCTGRVPGAAEGCGMCRDCDRVARGDHPNLLRLHEEQLLSASVLDVVDAVASQAWSRGWNVVLMEGAGRIPQNVFDALHRRIERHPAGVTFIMTAANEDAVPRRTRDLLLRIATDELGIFKREELLRSVCGAEGIELDEEALHLLARQGSGRPRALLNVLESMALRGPVTADEVRAHFRDPRTERALMYFERVLARASLRDQLSILRDEGGLSPGEVGAVIQGVLTSLLGATALGLADESLPFPFAEARSRSDLSMGLLDRRTALGLTPQQMFRRLVAWWSAPIEDEAGLIARLNEFDEWLNGPASASESAVEVGKGGMERRRRRQDELRALEIGRAASLVRRRSQGASEKFLNEMDVQRIWDAASFLIQKHGLYLSGRLSVCWGPGGDDDGRVIASAIHGLQHELRLWVVRREKSKTKDGDAKFHWVRVHARDEEGARWTHWGMAVSPGLDVRNWVEKYRRRQRNPLARGMKVEWDPGRGSKHQALQRHHEVLAYLLAGIDPLWRVWVEDESGRLVERPVFGLLGVGALRPAGSIFTTSRTAASRYIDGSYRAEAGKLLPALSMFDERKWGSALSGWEVHEHEYRRLQEAEYVRRVAEFDRNWPAKNPAMKERRAAEWGLLEKRWASEEALRVAGRPGIRGGD